MTALPCQCPSEVHRTGCLEGWDRSPSARAEPSPARKAMWARMTEAELQETVIRTAGRFGWFIHHDPPVTIHRRGGVRTLTVSKGSPGFPDLVLARAGEVLFVELKSEHGRFEPGQREWLRALGADAYVVKPRHMDRLLDRLRTPPKVLPANGTDGG